MGGPAAGDFLDRVLLLADMLEVDGADDVDAVGSELFYVAPAVSEPSAGRVVASQLVDQADLRVALEDGVNVDSFAPFDAESGDDLEFADHPMEFVGAFGLDGSDDHVLAALEASAAFVEHALGFAYAGGVAQKDFQAAPRCVGFLRLYLAEEFVGVGAAKVFGTHECCRRRFRLR
jgi:hypothetical protein